MVAHVVSRSPCSAAKPRASDALFRQLETSLKGQGGDLVKQVKGLIHFNIDGEDWTLDLRPESGEGSLTKGKPEDKPDLKLEMTDIVFAQLVAGKLNPQTAFLMRKLKLSGSMGMAMKLQPVLDAAAPKAKL